MLYFVFLDQYLNIFEYIDEIDKSTEEKKRFFLCE